MGERVHADPPRLGTNVLEIDSHLERLLGTVIQKIGVPTGSLDIPKTALRFVQLSLSRQGTGREGASNAP